MNSRGKKKIGNHDNIKNKKQKYNNESRDCIFGNLNEENIPSYSLSPGNFSPKKKRSIGPIQNIQPFTDNDDIAEIREQKRQKELNVQKDQLSDHESEKDSVSNFNLFSGMSQTEFKEHVMQCVKLCSENKITTKNAFTLQLIDCMAYMMKKDSSGSDFSTMACTLDASAKIYSLRVDSVCNDMHKLMDAFIAAMKRPARKGRENGENNDDEKESSPKVHRIRRQKTELASEESLTQKSVRKNFLRNYMKMTIGTGSFISCCNWDTNKNQPAIEKGIEFISNFQNQEKETCELDLKDFFTKEEMMQISKPNNDSMDGSKNNTIGLEELFVASEKQQHSIEISENIVDHSDERDESPPQLSNDWEFNDDPLEDDLFEEEVNVAAEKQQNCPPDIISIIEDGENDLDERQCIARRTEKLQAIFESRDGASEYSYLDQAYSPIWTGPDYWKKSYKGRQANNAKKGGKKKKNLNPMMFDNDQVDDEEVKTTSLSKLSNRTMLNWQEKKVTLPEDLRIDPNSFTRLFFRPRDKLFFNKLPKDDLICIDDLDISKTEVDSRNFMAITEDQRSSNGDDCDDRGGSPCQPNQETFGNQEENNDQHLSTDEQSRHSNPDLFEGSNLIPVPRLVNTQEIGYASKPNKVDMKELKTKLYDILPFHNNNKENSGPEEDSPQMKFSTLYTKLNQTFPTQDEDETVSPSMAFLALLHLCNEHDLHLNSIGSNKDDFTIDKLDPKHC
uniref:Condensin complex subunit 2 n=1 Tax=Clastoptera arizonana TaxID=38151 RepID=A0A1B6DGH5_9HEMI